MTNYYRWQGSALILRCHLQPRASKDEFSGLHGESIKIRIKAPPIDGKANAYLIGFLSRQFSVPKRNISIISGELSRQKTVKIEAPQKLPSELNIRSV